MAVDTNALTMAEYAIMSNDPRVVAVVFSLRDNGSIMARDIPFVNRPSLTVSGVRWVDNLPTVDWVALNAEGAVTKGTPTPFQEQVYIIRNKIQIDKYIQLDQNQIGSPMGNQIAAYTRSVAYDFNDKFVNNAHGSGDTDSIVGLRARLDNPATYKTRAGSKIDAAATMTTAMSAANANNFFEKLDQLLYELGDPDGNGVVLYLNEVMLRRIHFALRLLGTALDQTRDQFDRVITTYKAAVLRDIGLKTDQSTRIITTTETAAGADGSSTQTSIYGVRYGLESFFGWQFSPLFVSPPALTEGGAVNQVVIDWAGGIVMQSTYSIGRLFNINLG